MNAPCLRQVRCGATGVRAQFVLGYANLGFMALRLCVASWLPPFEGGQGCCSKNCNVCGGARVRASAASPHLLSQNLLSPKQKSTDNEVRTETDGKTVGFAILFVLKLPLAGTCSPIYSFSPSVPSHTSNISPNPCVDQEKVSQ